MAARKLRRDRHRTALSLARELRGTRVRDLYTDGEGSGCAMKIALWAIWWALPLVGQVANRELPVLTTHGEATVSLTPDIAELDIGVVSQAASSEEAAQQNEKRASALMAQLRTVTPSASFKTVNVSVNPNYRYPKDGGTPKVLGYTASDTVRIDIPDVSLLRKVIEAATKSGANNANRLTFALRNENEARGNALSQAAEQARTGAEALARTLKVKLGRIVHVEEVEPVIISPAREVDISSLKEEAGTVSIAPGTIQVHASVNLTFEIAAPNR